MKRMKYLLLLFVCLFALGTLVACGDEGSNDNNQNVETNGGNQTQVPPTEDPKTEVPPQTEVPPTDGPTQQPTVDVTKVTFEDETVEYTGEAIAFTVKNLPGGVTVKYTYLYEGNEVSEMVEIGEYEVTAVITDKNTGVELRVLSAILTIIPVQIFDEIPNDANSNIELTYTTNFFTMHKNPDDETQLIAAGLELYASETIYFVLDRKTGESAENFPLNFLELDASSVECASIIENALVISEPGTYDVIMMFPEDSLVPLILVREGADNDLFYFRGTVNNFEATEEYLFVKDETTNTSSYEIQLTAGEEFKIANYYYSVSFDFTSTFLFLDGFGVGTDNGNVKVVKEGNYKFIVDLDTKSITVYRDGQELVADRNVIYIRGTVTNPAWDSLSLPLGKNNGINVIEVSLKVGDVFKIADASWGVIYDYGYFSSAVTNFGNDADNNIVVKVAGTYKIEVDMAGNKVSVYCDGNKIVDNATSTGGGNQQGGQTEYNYQLVINGTQKITLTYKGKAWVENEEHDEFVAYNVYLAAGDVVTLFDVNNNAGWAITSPNPWSSGSPVGSANGITMGESGYYDVYVQFLFQKDKIYFGPAGA